MKTNKANVTLRGRAEEVGRARRRRRGALRPHRHGLQRQRLRRGALPGPRAADPGAEA